VGGFHVRQRMKTSEKERRFRNRKIKNDKALKTKVRRRNGGESHPLWEATKDEVMESPYKGKKTTLSTQKKDKEGVLPKWGGGEGVADVEEREKRRIGTQVYTVQK